MNRRLARALVALAIPALAVPALTTPAVAAPKGPAVPTIDEVAKIYPHLEDGVSEVETDTVPRIKDDCSDGKPYAGSTYRSAYYSDDSFAWTAAKPMVTTGAMSFRKAGQAAEFFDDFSGATTECFGLAEDEADVKVTSKKIPLKLGDEAFGATVTMRSGGQKTVMHVLLARQGKVIAMSMVMSSPKASPVKKAIRLERLALDTAS